MGKQNFGVIGLAVMGKNLALNIESRGYSVSVYSRDFEETEKLLEEANGRNITGVFSLEELVKSLETPRKILIMIRAGKPVDEVIGNLKPYLSEGDILIDGGNSYFMDTIRRCREMEAEGFRYIGAGVSGGEEGALKGPSLMPGGSREAYPAVEPIFNAIAARVDGESCCTYVAGDGAGHYVKMVHNGIEYGDMQLISEAYLLLKNILKLENSEIADIFHNWNTGELNSYLIEITSHILRKKDMETGNDLLDMILDTAGQKGTGKWGSQSALELGVAAPTITEAVYARCLSAVKNERTEAAKLYRSPDIELTGKKAELIESIRRALYASKICSYAQGFALLRTASENFGWDMQYGNIAMIFRGGCIIRAQFLQKIKEAYDRKPELANLLMDTYFSGLLENYQEDWRRVISISALSGMPVPGFMSALSYFDSYRTERLPSNLLQAQRDYFGAHMYERTDKPRGEFFHTDWTGLGGTTSSSAYNA